MISYAIVLAIVVSLMPAGQKVAGNTTNFDNADFWAGLSTWAFQLRFDGLVLVFLLPLIVALSFKSRRGIFAADSILILIVGTLFLAPLLVAFTGFYIQPYRFITVIVFFAVGVGMLLSKRIE